ncbi:MAG: hypothetical protein ACI8VW_000895 [bacterium]|jgi:hypothetical protein
MNGFEFLDAFKKMREKSGGCNAIVFVMITSSDNSKGKERASQYDFVKCYMNKMPTTAEKLRSHIGDYIPG